MYDRKYSLYEGVSMRGSSNAPKIVHSNKNLLDNWDFTNPVNQRGQSSYSSYPNTNNDNIFSLDRWHLSTGYLGVDNDYCSFGRTRSTNSAVLYQELNQDTIKSIVGKTITASIKFSDGSYHSFTYLIPTTLSSNIDTLLGSFAWTVNSRNYHIDLWNWKDNNNLNHLNHIQFRVWEDELGTYSSSNRLKISAVKLELGEVSTLKNDVLGVNYAKELLKCQRYFERSKYQVTYGTALDTNVLEHTDSYFYKKEKRIDECIFTVDPASSQSLQVYDVSDGKLELVSNCILVPPTTYNNYCYSPRIESPNNKFITGRRYLARIGDNAYSISADL